MRFTIISTLLLTALLYSSCKKQDVAASSTGPDNCSINTSLGGTVIPGQYIIAYKPSGTLLASAAGMKQKSRDVLAENDIPTTAVRSSFEGERAGFVAHITEEQAKKLSADASIASVEPDRIVALGTCFTIVSPTLITWNINKVGYGNGIGKTAWIVDSGIDFTHPDLNVDTLKSKSFVDSEPSANDENGHGTHVAGIIGAKNNNYGVLGVASGATLVSLKVLDKDGNGTLSSIIQALAYASTHAKAGDVVNLSLGEESSSDILDQEVQSIASQGMFVTIAAGNDSKAADLYSPARANGTNIFTVSAVDSLDNFASFSNFGNDAVDYAAPGVRVLSTYKGGLYAKMSGTSMAAPHVAGLLLVEGNHLHDAGTAKNDPDGNADRIVHL
ncbi:MAG: S8 family serine peptidase [Flavisolibacter sp.]